MAVQSGRDPAVDIGGSHEVPRLWSGGALSARGPSPQVIHVFLEREGTGIQPRRCSGAEPPSPSFLSTPRSLARWIQL